jgi:hypothetical protein
VCEREREREGEREREVEERGGGGREKEKESMCGQWVCVFFKQITFQERFDYFTTLYLREK